MRGHGKTLEQMAESRGSLPPDEVVTCPITAERCSIRGCGLRKCSLRSHLARLSMDRIASILEPYTALGPRPTDREVGTALRTCLTDRTTGHLVRQDIHEASLKAIDSRGNRIT